MKQINIVYAPGSGGNHVANIISMNKTYPLGIDESVYDNNTLNVHQSEQRRNENIKINLFHLGNFILHCKKHLVKDCGKNILISTTMVPDKSSLSYKRLGRWSPIYLDHFHFFEHTQFYSTFSLSRLSGTDNWIVIDTSILFNNNIDQLLSKLSLLDLEIDSDLATIFHKKWIDKIEKIVSDNSSPD